MKFEIFDLKYHYFDTKNIEFGEICGLDSQTEVSYVLSSNWGRPQFPKIIYAYMCVCRMVCARCIRQTQLCQLYMWRHIAKHKYDCEEI